MYASRDITMSEISQAERQISCDITHMQNLENDANKFIYKTETDLWLPKWRGGVVG